MLYAKELTEDQISEFREAFNLFDRDMDGYIIFSDLKYILTKLGWKLSDRDIACMVAEFDSDDNKKIDFSEFLTIMARKHKEDETKEEMERAFKVFDKDGKGYITTQDISDIFSAFGEKIKTSDLNAVVKKLCTDGHQTIDYDNFIRLLNKQF